MSPMPDDLERLFDLSLDLLCIAGFDGYFKRLNPTWERVLGFTIPELLSRPYLDFVHPDDRGATEQEAAKLIETGAEVFSFRNRFVCRDGSYRWLLWSSAPSAEHRLMYAAAKDITDLKKSEDRLAADYAVVRVLAESPTLELGAPEILKAVCRCLDWTVGAIWSIDDDGAVIRCVDLWHGPNANVPEFAAMTRRAQFSLGVGLPGRVWATGQPGWVADMEDDFNFPRSNVALKEGLHCAFGFPIRVGDQVIGVIEFFSPEIRNPDHDVLQMFDAIGSQIGQFIERRRAEASLERYARQLEAARRAE